MKANKVSAFRVKRGLRRVSGAEPQVVGLTPQTTDERKTDTMKTYILRPAKPVEPQKSSPATQPKPAVPVPIPGPVLFIGLDVHNDSIAVSLAPAGSTEVRRYGIIGGEHDDVLRLVHKLQAAHPGTALKVCYEAGPRGFALGRCLRSHGVACILVCPSKVPRKPGERVKTDRRDADDLARLYRAGELTGIYVPEPEDEAMRDLLRARFQVGRQQHRARQQLKMYLLRHNLRYGGQTSWTPAHLRYLAKIKMPFPVQQIVFQEMLEVISEATARLER
jgi:transposase